MLVATFDSHCDPILIFYLSNTILYFITPQFEFNPCMRLINDMNSSENVCFVCLFAFVVVVVVVVVFLQKNIISFSIFFCRERLVRSPVLGRRKIRTERTGGFFSGLRRRRKGGYNHVNKMKAVERDKMQRRRQPTVYRYSSQEHDTATSSESRPESCRGDSVKSSKSSSFRDKVVANVAVVVSEADTPPASPEIALLRPESSQEALIRQKETAKAVLKGVTTLQDVYRESAIREGLYNTKSGEGSGKGTLDQLLENEEPTDEFGPYESHTDMRKGNTNTMVDIEEETCLSDSKSSDDVVAPAVTCIVNGKDAPSRPPYRQSPNIPQRRFSHDTRLPKQGDGNIKRPGNRGRTLSVDEMHRSTPMLSQQSRTDYPTGSLAESRTTVSAENLYPNLSHYMPVHDTDKQRQISRGKEGVDPRTESPMRHAFSDQSIQCRKKTECPPKSSDSFSHRKFNGKADIQLKLKLGPRKIVVKDPRGCRGGRRATTPDGAKSKVWNDDSFSGLVHNRSVPLRALSSIKSSDV